MMIKLSQGTGKKLGHIAYRFWSNQSCKEEINQLITYFTLINIQEGLD